MRTMALRTDKTRSFAYGPQFNQLGERMKYKIYAPLGTLDHTGLHSIVNMRLEVQNGQNKPGMGVEQGMHPNPNQATQVLADVQDDTIQAPLITDTPVQPHDNTVDAQDDPLSGIKFITLETK